MEDAVEAIERIEKYVARGRAAFDADELIQAWIVHHLEILGEALSHVPQSVRDLAPALPWSLALGMRNVLVHGYFGIDLDQVWNTAVRDLPALKGEIIRLLQRLPPA